MRRVPILPIILAAALSVSTGAAAIPAMAHETGTENEVLVVETQGVDEEENAVAEPDDGDAAVENDGADEPAADEIDPVQNIEKEEAESQEETPSEEASPEEALSEEVSSEKPASVESVENEEPAENVDPAVNEEPAGIEEPVDNETDTEPVIQLQSAAARPAVTSVPETADADTSHEEHHLAFASDYHSTEGSIENAMSGMPEDVEYVSLIGDMVGDRGGSHPEYESRQILELVKEVFPDLDNTNVSIVWATHDLSVDDQGTGIVKCMDGVSEPIREGKNEDNTPAYYIYGIGHYDMTEGNAVSQGAAAAFKTWVNGINHTIPLIVLCHVPIQASRGDNNGASYWNEALNYAATGVEGITTTDATADIIRNVLFLHGHNHTNDPVEHYFGAGTTLSVQVDKSSGSASEGMAGPPGPPGSHGRKAEGLLSNIYYSSLTAGYLKTSGNATLVTVQDGALTLTKYNGDSTVSLGTDGATKEALGHSITIAAQRHVEGQTSRENVHASTCDHGGEYDLIVYCTICGEELSRTHILTEAAGHRWGDWTVVRKATATARGKESRTCAVCGSTQSRPIPALSPEQDGQEEPASPQDREPSAVTDDPAGNSGNDAADAGAADTADAAPAPGTNTSSQKTFTSPATSDESLWILWAAAIAMSWIGLMVAIESRGQSL